MRWFLTEGHWRTASLLSDIIPNNGALSPLNFNISDLLLRQWYERVSNQTSESAI
jgi:hypothetical protein